MTREFHPKDTVAHNLYLPLPPSFPFRYNKRQMDFNELREYNDYLEQVEDIIFNLCEGIDVKATEAKVDAYRKENAGEIARLNKRNEEEDRRIAEEKGSEWAPRRMSLDGSDVGDTPGPTGGAGGFGGMFGHTPGTGGAAGGGPPRPVMAVPKPTAMPQSGGKAAHGAWDHGLDQSAEGRAKREAAIAKACGVDMHALGMARARQEALQSIFC